MKLFSGQSSQILLLLLDVWKVLNLHPELADQDGLCSFTSSTHGVWTPLSTMKVLPSLHHQLPAQGHRLAAIAPPAALQAPLGMNRSHVGLLSSTALSPAREHTSCLFPAKALGISLLDKHCVWKTRYF